jgi:MFS family permease
LVASSLGSVFEWYDFFIYGTLAAFFGVHFFPPESETSAFLSSLALFGVGFAVRPLGALVFGRLGDLTGRKHTFLLTIVIMGLSTALVGVLPGYAHIGILAPIALVSLRLAQGLALGGEYGGAAIYVAESAPSSQRGRYTSWIQVTATLGLLLSLLVILGTRLSMSAQRFSDWGWRLPFLASLGLLGVSVYVRLKLRESPVFAAMKARGAVSQSPLRESLTRWPNVRLMLVVLFGAIAGQSVTWYTGQFYALYFLTTTLKVDTVNAYVMLAFALLLGAPMFLIFGALSDRLGRKKVMLAGFALAVAIYFPVFHGLTRAANPALAEAMRTAPVVLRTTEDAHGWRLVLAAAGNAFGKIVGRHETATPTDLARDFLDGRGIPFTLAPAGPDAPLALEVGVNHLAGFNPKAYLIALTLNGYPTEAAPTEINKLKVILLLVALLACTALTYGPLAALLVEMFPTHIRYTSLSLPYHLGHGWFGGFLPLIVASLALFTGNIYAGLWYPVGVAALSLVVGAVFLRDRPGAPLWD